jgi:hypothetical protein
VDLFLEDLPKLACEFLAGVSHYAKVRRDIPDGEAAELVQADSQGLKGHRVRFKVNPMPFVQKLKEIVGEQRQAEINRYYIKLLCTLGKDRMLELAEEAVAQVSAGSTSRSPAGEFLKLCERHCNPLAMDQLRQIERIASLQSAPWTPRGYQTEMATKAWTLGNAIVVAPTGTGKTKVISLVLERLWQSRPKAKVVAVNEKIVMVLQLARDLKTSCRSGDKRVTVYCSSRTVPANVSWEELLDRSDCMVFTPAYLKQTWERILKLGGDCAG